MDESIYRNTVEILYDERFGTGTGKRLEGVHFSEMFVILKPIRN